MSSKATVFTSAMGITLLASGCHLYEDNFTDEGQYYSRHPGHYGINGQCNESRIDGELPPEVILIEYYQIHLKACKIGSIKKKGGVFFLKPKAGTCKQYSSPDVMNRSFEFVEPFSVEVEKIDKHKTRITVNGKNDRIVERCKIPD